MKKVLLTAAVLTTIFLSGCEKNETLVPAETSLLKADKGIQCRGCGQWDIVDPEEEGATAFRATSASSDTTTTSTPVKSKGRK